METSFLDQIRANNDPNSELRRKFRNEVAPKLEQSKKEDKVISSHQDSIGQTVEQVVDQQGENWGVIKNWSWNAIA